MFIIFLAQSFFCWARYHTVCSKHRHMDSPEWNAPGWRTQVVLYLRGNGTVFKLLVSTLHERFVQAWHQDQFDEARRKGLLIRRYGNHESIFPNSVERNHWFLPHVGWHIARYTAHSPSVCASSQVKFCKLSVLPQLVSHLWRVSLMSPWPMITNSTLFHCLFQCWPPKSDDYEVLNSTFSPFLMLMVLFSQIHIAKLWYHCSSVFCIHPALNLPVSSFLMLISVI